MLSPLRGWLHAVQYHFLTGHSSCGDAVIYRFEQFSTPNKRNFKTHASGYHLFSHCDTKKRLALPFQVETESVDHFRYG